MDNVSDISEHLTDSNTLYLMDNVSDISEHLTDSNTLYLIYINIHTYIDNFQN